MIYGSLTYPVIITKQSETSYIADFPDIPGVTAIGKSYDDVIKASDDAIALKFLDPKNPWKGSFPIPSRIVNIPLNMYQCIDTAMVDITSDIKDYTFISNVMKSAYPFIKLRSRKNMVLPVSSYHIGPNEYKNTVTVNNSNYCTFDDQIIHDTFEFMRDAVPINLRNGNVIIRLSHSLECYNIYEKHDEFDNDMYIFNIGDLVYSELEKFFFIVLDYIDNTYCCMKSFIPNNFINGRDNLFDTPTNYSYDKTKKNIINEYGCSHPRECYKLVTNLTDFQVQYFTEKGIT